VVREQDQFLEVVDRDVAERRWLEAVRPRVLGAEAVSLHDALGRVLASDVVASVDVPAFDRSNLDGFAVRAADTFGAAEETPQSLKLNDEDVGTGVVPRLSVEQGAATPIATGGMLPRGADAVAMVELTQVRAGRVVVLKPVAPGAGVSFAGADMARGELVLRKGTRLTSRETAVLAAIGLATVDVVRRPRVAILSTGDEIVAPGTPLPPASVYDSNATMLADAVRELGAEPVALGVAPDDEVALDSAFDRGLKHDLLLLSGGTSKGVGDVSYRVLSRRSPGAIVHGVALKPGKPICLGVVGETPAAILPGFPTSAIFTFHEFVAPLLRRMLGLPPETAERLSAVMPRRFNSERGRTEYLLVNLVDGPEGRMAYPLGKGSGSVTTFSRADGFLTIPKNQELIDAGETVEIVPIGERSRPADVLAIGSHCTGLDALLGLLAEMGFVPKTLWVGSQGGLAAAASGECDIAGVHLLDPESGVYNRPFLPAGVELVEGYRRMQGLVFRKGDARFDGRDMDHVGRILQGDPSLLMVNRNRGSGTRVLIDELLAGHRPAGHAIEARSHNAVAAAVVQARADWGVAIAPVAALYGLGFVALREEHYDFAIPKSRWDRPGVRAFRELLRDPRARSRLAALGFLVSDRAS
jgi:putative molybdopterin biosynthesis protein